MKKKNWIVVALCIAIVGMGIGFAALAQNLQINATANITGQWDVRIEAFAFDDWSSKGATVNNLPDNWMMVEGTSMNINVDLAYPGAFAIFNIQVNNHGNIDAILNSITGVTAANSSEPSEVQFSIKHAAGDYFYKTDVNASDIPIDSSNPFALHLDAADARNFILRVEWVVEDGIESIIPDIKSKTATINLNYVQHT